MYDPKSYASSTGEYYTKNLFLPQPAKNCEEISPYFSLSEVENYPKLHFLGTILSI